MSSSDLAAPLAALGSRRAEPGSVERSRRCHEREAPRPGTMSWLSLVELYAPDDAKDAAYYHSDAACAKKWPAEAIWVSRKR